MDAVAAPGRCLLSWDSGRGPSWDYDPETLSPKNARRFESTEVFRSDSASGPGVSLGTTKAEAYMDWHAPDGRVVYYWAVATTPDGMRIRVGPTMRVEMPARRKRSAGLDTVPPCATGDVKVRRSAGGNAIHFKPSVDVHSGVLCYFVYTSNQDQPDHVVWLDSVDTESSTTHDVFLDRAGGKDDGYVVRAVDHGLNLSELIDPVTPEPGGEWRIVRPLGDDEYRYEGCAMSSDGMVQFACRNIWSLETGYVVQFVRSTDGGSTWSDVTPGFVSSTAEPRHCGMSDDGEVILVSGYRSGCYLSTDGGSSWSDVTHVCGQAGSDYEGCAVSGDGDTLLLCYAEWWGHLYQSQDRGQTWRHLDPSGQVDYDISTPSSCSHVATNADGSVIFVQQGYWTYLSTDGGDSWAENRPVINSCSWSCYDMSPDGKVIMAAANYIGSGDGRLYATTDRGATWTELTPQSYPLTARWTAVACSDDGEQLLAIVQQMGYAYASEDGAETWSITKPRDEEYSRGDWITCAVSGDGLMMMAASGDPAYGLCVYRDWP